MPTLWYLFNAGGSGIKGVACPKFEIHLLNPSGSPIFSLDYFYLLRQPPDQGPGVGQFSPPEALRVAGWGRSVMLIPLLVSRLSRPSPLTPPPGKRGHGKLSLLPVSGPLRTRQVGADPHPFSGVSINKLFSNYTHPWPELPQPFLTPGSCSPAQGLSRELPESAQGFVCSATHIHGTHVSVCLRRLVVWWEEFLSSWWSQPDRKSLEGRKVIYHCLSHFTPV